MTATTIESDAGTQDVPSSEVRRDMYRLMVEIRHFEKRWMRIFNSGKTGPGHSSIGMEAIAAAFGTLLGEGDKTYATYRGHAHTLARGVPMNETMAELLGRATGLNGGKGGSMHLTSVDHGMMGSYAIIGAHLPVATGAALASKYKGEDTVTVCFFGDGTTNIGAFHEAINLAAIWSLPVIFVCENNQYMEYTPIRDVTAVDRPAADRAASYGLPAIEVDGNDPDLLHAAASAAIERARAGQGPSLIEAVTYRHLGHASADPGKYRPQEEIDEWIGRDPVPMYKARLVEAGVPAEDLDEMEQQIIQRVEQAADFALASPLPAVDTLMTNVWANGDSSWRR
ncbi:thiamine pyrophosphate-dependent dehydrogenase E1 component subunit alpha [Dietzia lutea]|uniref:Pyruvate dehydrogenase (Acetyl-transferring) E1 component subunit alpha n=1 Tax=Dietzia lutea TaxID=546160 RepID=A0A2S1R9Y4_9ACTN|nr:thiamine pyrophosphate-dependent dehydrogenase E1 component subunit alpha [Dietzia lutea]AWH93072.1 pyruvate dehydrogenase (acetyl-transferring) E1 component subunit alpha [Dietzia lutea]AWH93098.1 pyruvate dehydrogenase (acetyl-transferring) E1 component subunit alpha [Dietzia lutea]